MKTQTKFLGCDFVSPEKVCNVVRITTTTTTSVNPTFYGIVGKVDKAENTIINMADCPKYALTSSIVKESRCVTSIDRSIEHVINCQEEVLTEAKPKCETFDEADRPVLRTGPRIIEITEENCDSFHENLEFFSRRRGPAADDSKLADDSRESEKKVKWCFVVVIFIFIFCKRYRNH